ncbi:MAG: hypothetical protein ABI697_11005 [Devosia sp.]
MLRRRDKWFEIAAALCGIAAAIAYFGFHNDRGAIVAIVAGALSLLWAYLDVTPR